MKNVENIYLLSKIIKVDNYDFIFVFSFSIGCYTFGGELINKNNLHIFRWDYGC